MVPGFELHLDFIRVLVKIEITKSALRDALHRPRAVYASDFESDPRARRDLSDQTHSRFGRKQAGHADFEESVSKDSRVSVKKDDGEA